LKTAEFPILKGSWPWPWHWIGPYCIPSCITHRHLPTCQISLKSNKRFCGRTDGRTDGRAYVRMHGRTDIWDRFYYRSTLSKSRPTNEKRNLTFQEVSPRS